MNNKIILRIISIIMAVCVVLTVGGCKKSASGNSNNPDKDAKIVNGEGNPVQPVIDEKESSAIIKYTKVNAKGREEEATTVVKINSPIINEISMGSTVADTYKTDKEKENFVNNAVKNDGIDKDQAEEIIKNPTKWVAFNYTVYIANTNAQRLITSFMEVGKKNSNITVKTNLDCEYSIKSGSGTEIFISGYVNVNEYPDEESLIAELNGMGVKLIYTLANDKVTDIDNWDEVTTKKMDIKF